MSYTVADVDRVMDGNWYLLKYQVLDDIPTELGVISYEKDFGGEGQGDQYWVVVKIQGHDGSTRYFRKDGWYQSYSGGELDGDIYEVKPTPKTVVFYE